MNFMVFGFELNVRLTSPQKYCFNEATEYNGHFSMRAFQVI